MKAKTKLVLRGSHLLLAVVLILAIGIAGYYVWRVAVSPSTSPNLNSLPFPLPNWEGGTPPHVNFYTTWPEYPEFVFVDYCVIASPYITSDEVGWLSDALRQMRLAGASKFPSIRFVVVAVCNRAEHTSEATFASSYKVAIVCKASDVFDRSLRYEDIVRAAVFDETPVAMKNGKQVWPVVDRFKGGVLKLAQTRWPNW